MTKKFRVSLIVGVAVLVAVLLVVLLPFGVSVKSSGRVSITNSIVLAASGWVSPISDTANGWIDSSSAWDDNTGTFAYHSTPSGWGPYLELYHTELQCTKVQGWWGIVNAQVTTIEVDVYYSGAYNNIYSGVIVPGSFQEYEIGSEQAVTAMRVRFYATKAARQAEVYETDFWEVTGAVPNISNAPTSKGFGVVAPSTDYWSNGGTPTFPLDDGECYFTVTNSSGAAVDITVKGTNFIGGAGWTLSGSPSEDIVTLKAGKSGDELEANMVTLTTSELAFISNLPDTESKKWELKLETGTFTDGAVKTGIVTLTATLSQPMVGQA